MGAIDISKPQLWSLLPLVLFIVYLFALWPHRDVKHWSFALACLTAGLLWVRGSPKKDFAVSLLERWDPPTAGRMQPTRALSTLGFLLIPAGFWILTLHAGDYFSFDDNINEVLPVLVRAFDDFLATGRIPMWNPYQFMGAPIGEVSLYSLCYPPLYLSLWIAHRFLAEPTWTFNVYFLLHAGAGYLLCMRLLRSLSVGDPLSLLASLSFVFCGYFVVAGSCWDHMIPYLVWIPLAGLSLEHWEDRRRLSWKAVTALALSGGVWSGNPQMACYLSLLWLTGVAWLVHETPPGNRLEAVSALPGTLCLTAAAAAPILLPQFSYFRQVTRVLDLSGGIDGGLWSLLFPWPLHHSYHPNPWVWLERPGQLYFAGGLLTFAALAAIAFFLGRLLLLSPAKRKRPEEMWLVAGSVALLLALGKVGGLNELLSNLPVAKGFSNPFKLLPFLHFFFLVGGAVFLQRVCRGKGGASLAVVGVGILAFHLFSCEQESDYRKIAGLPPLPPELSELKNAAELGYVRIVPESYVESIASWKDQPLGMGANFATYYGVGSAIGYDPLVDASQANLALATRWRANPEQAEREWGITYKVIVDPPGKPVRPGSAAYVTNNGNRITLVPLSKSRPIAFFENAPEKAVPFRAHFNGLDFSSVAASGPLTIAFLHRPNFQAEADGKPVLVEKDDWGRLRLDVPAGWKSLSLRYRPKWNEGLIAALLLLVLTGALLKLETKWS